MTSGRKTSATLFRNTYLLSTTIPTISTLKHGNAMGDEPSESDQALLARLHAIKPSTVSFEKDASLLPPLISESEDTPDDLIARFQRIHGKQAVVQPLDNGLDGVGSKEEVVRSASPTIEELLEEIGTDTEYKLDETELQNAEKLMAEARGALARDDGERMEPSSTTATSLDGAPSLSNTPVKYNQQTEDEEAAAALERILDKSQFEDHYDEEQASPNPKATAIPPRHSSGPAADTFAALQFPTVPEDVSFDNLIIPSAPTDAPSDARRKKEGAKKQDAAINEVETWCIICCGNAAVRCFGCDKDLYCWGCWREGHMGESAGLEERQHVWERYKKANAKAKRGG